MVDNQFIRFKLIYEDMLEEDIRNMIELLKQIEIDNKLFEKCWDCKITKVNKLTNERGWNYEDIPLCDECAIIYNYNMDHQWLTYYSQIL